MGAINYMTSPYITMGLKPYDISEYADEDGNIDYDLLEMDYEVDRTNIESILSRYPFYYFHVEIKAIAAAVKDMREEVKITPTWLQYERETA